jgi:hypothetical protein
MRDGTRHDFCGARTKAIFQMRQKNSLARIYWLMDVSPSDGVRGGRRVHLSIKNPRVVAVALFGNPSVGEIISLLS